MAGADRDQEKALADLREQFPYHRIRRRGDWVATLMDESRGVDPTVIRSSAEDLRAALIKDREAAARRVGSRWAR